MKGFARVVVVFLTLAALIVGFAARPSPSMSFSPPTST